MSIEQSQSAISNEFTNPANRLAFALKRLERIKSLMGREHDDRTQAEELLLSFGWTSDESVHDLVRHAQETRNRTMILTEAAIVVPMLLASLSEIPDSTRLLALTVASILMLAIQQGSFVNARHDIAKANRLGYHEAVEAAQAARRIEDFISQFEIQDETTSPKLVKKTPSK